ncbi:MAG: chorismate-binding protein [Myxococcota bacterium]
MPDLTDFATFARLASSATIVPVSRSIVADDLTPVQVFATVGGEGAILLESVVGGEKWARYSFVGFDPLLVVRGAGTRFEIRKGGDVQREQGVDPYERLREVLAAMTPPPASELRDLPRFWGGAVGYLCYDAIRRFEPTVGVPLSDDDDELAFAIGHTLLVFDNLHQTIRVVVPARTGGDLRAAYDAAVAKIEAVIARLREPARPRLLPLPERASGALPDSSFDRAGFEAAVRRTQEHIAAGDIFQLVLAQRFEIDQGAVDPFDIYRAMRVVNPSPYMFFLRLGRVEIAGASPETLVRVEDGVATVRPIAGTRPRGETEAEDAALAEELLQDPKERAEHVMLVDLGRNDLGRISQPGTVRLTEEMIIERYSHVMHITSNVEGELAEGRDALDVLRATFPAGTLSGAPKVRAMQIIEELEPVRRGLYGGAVGYVGFDGNADLAIAIRTVVAKDGKLTLQAGAGIVEASDPALEFDESVNKAKAGLVAIETARAAER